MSKQFSRASSSAEASSLQGLAKEGRLRSSKGFCL